MRWPEKRKKRKKGLRGESQAGTEFCTLLRVCTVPKYILEIKSRHVRTVTSTLNVLKRCSFYVCKTLSIFKEIEKSLFTKVEQCTLKLN